MKKNKKIWNVQKWGFGEEWRGEWPDSKSKRPGVR
jgi:hypothetical protein